MCDTGRKTCWRREYVTLHGIDMRIRMRPPYVVQRFCEFAEKTGVFPENARVLDIGCGEGRIGVHLAARGMHVTGFDFIEESINRFRENVSKLGLDTTVTLMTGDIMKTWPVGNQSQDAAFAITVIENILDNSDMEFFLSELQRVLVPGGIAVFEWYVPGDGYYDALHDMNSPPSDRILKIDRNNNLVFRMYSPEEIRERLLPWFEILDQSEHRFTSSKYRGTYRRKTQVLIGRLK